MYFYDGIEDFLKDLDDHIFTEEEIKRIVDELIEYIEIEDYYNGIEFSTPSPNDLGTYNFFTKKIKINRQNIIWTAEDDYDNSGLTDNKTLFINICILEAIFHEIVHAIQNYVAFDANWPLSPLFQMEIMLFNGHVIDDDTYDRFHDLFIIEREANTTSLENILCILRNYVEDDELFEHFLNRLHGFMMIGYEKDTERIVSPIEFVYENLYKMEVPYIHGIDLYDRVKLGFSISQEEYEQYIKDKNAITLAKNDLK